MLNYQRVSKFKVPSMVDLEKDRSEPQHGGKQEQNRTKGSTWQWKPSGNRSLFTCVRALPIATLQCLYNRICSHVFLEQP